MSHIPIANLLTEFSSSEGPGIPVAKISKSDGGDRHQALSAGFEQLPNAGTSAIDDAFNRGFEEGQREAEARLAHAIGELKAAAELKLNQTRQSWASDLGQQLSGELIEAVERMHHQLADSFAEVLLPIITDVVRADAVRNIATAIRSTTAGDWQGPILVTGPGDLLEALRDGLGDMATIIECRVASGPDIKVTINETVLETQLGPWADVVKRILT